MEDKDRILQILNGLGLKGQVNEQGFVRNQTESETALLHEVEIRAKITRFQDGDVRVDIDFTLPEWSVLASTYMDHCGVAENIPRNHGNEYCHGPQYRDYRSELHGKQTSAFSPWNNRSFCVRSANYKADEIDEAVGNATHLASLFARHLGELSSLRYWNTDDPEVTAKAKEIIARTDLHETDVDREERAHRLEDRNSFIKGWFYPFNDKGKGTFDTILFGVGFAAKMIGNEGSFEYAIACNVLVDQSFIAKARKACFIREETTTVKY